MQITSAKQQHVPAITNIFNHYILHTDSRFETSPFTLENRRVWFSRFAEDSPHQLLVAVEQGRVVGFAGAQPYRDSHAFGQTVETTIYLSPDWAQRGVGTRLYSSLFERLANQNLHVALAGIALPNQGSLALHEKFGFCRIGIFEEYAIKNGRYISTIWMQKRLSGDAGLMGAPTREAGAERHD